MDEVLDLAAHVIGGSAFDAAAHREEAVEFGRLKHPSVPEADARQRLERILGIAELLGVDTGDADADDIVIGAQREIDAAADAAAIGMEIGVVAMIAAGLNFLRHGHAAEGGQSRRKHRATRQPLPCHSRLVQLPLVPDL